jgi:2-keto-4-pentenoate hydratase/2-oxohepta-3-ene-1,7-dioic acid hydratase in catechol pathway
MVVVLGVGAETEGMNEEEKRRFGEAYVSRQRAEAEPYIFMKPVTAIAGPDTTLPLPDFSDRIDWELELAAVIGKPTHRVSEADALSHVAGYMIANDVTARDRVNRTDAGAIGPDWIAAKGAPGFLPIGPDFVPSQFVGDPQQLAMKLLVNGVTMQDDSTSDMTFSVARQIAYLSRFAKLCPGDIICTGSPAGNGVTQGIFLKDGDVMEAEIERLGRQLIRCESAPA